MDRSMTENVQDLYEHLHTIPEKGMLEYKTSVVIINELEKYGYDVIKQIGGETGVIGIIDTGKKGPVLGLRADMDALEYVIDNNVEMRHTCGHDAHMAMLLAAAREIKLHNIVKKGKLKIIFQPAEERMSGALSLIDAGVLDDVTNIFGMHVRPAEEIPFGTASPALKHGSCCLMTCKINGQQAHGARPHLGINVVDIAASVVNAINAIKEKPSISHSIKVTNITVNGDAYNVIPDELFMALDIRSQENDVMENMLHKVVGIFDHITQAFGGTYEITKKGVIPAAEYDKEMIDVADTAIRNVMGDGASVGILPTTGGEDFHFITKKLSCKASYIGLGADVKPGLHHKDMVMNKAALPIGAEIWIDIVKQMLG